MSSSPRPCPLCASPRHAALRRFEHAHLRRCAACGFVYAGRLPSAEQLTGHYAAYGRDDRDSPITRRRYDELLDGFEAYRTTNRILDMGCGVGYFLERAAARGWEVHGSEVGDEPLRINRAKGIEMRAAPVRAKDYEQGSFDVVTAFEVVEHVADPCAESSTLAQILRRGGLFYCTTPNFDSASRRMLGPAWNVIEYPEHLGYFTTATLRGWLAAAGFDTIAITTTGVSPRRLLDGLRRRAPAPGDQEAGGVARDDERLRAAIETSRVLGSAKDSANALLSAARAGDTLKGRFVLRDHPT